MIIGKYRSTIHKSCEKFFRISLALVELMTEYAAWRKLDKQREYIRRDTILEPKLRGTTNMNIHRTEKDEA